MKRLVLGTAALLAITLAAGLVFFSASKYRVRDQAYLDSLSDFLFMVGSYNAEGLGFEAPRLTDARYRQAGTPAGRGCREAIDAERTRGD